MSTPPQPEDELEALLRRAAPERPDPERRAAARAAFLAGAEEGSRAGAAPRTGGVVNAAEDEDRFEAWLAQRRVSLPASEAARRRARLAFLTPLAAEPVRTRRGSPAVRGFVLALAAAAILLVTFVLPRPERWEVRLGGSAVRLAGVEFEPGDEGRLAAELESGGRLETSAGRARFSLGDRLDFELLPGASVDFPALPELDGVSPIAFEDLAGEAYLRTRVRYPGNPIRVGTPLAEVALHGTTVGVRVDADCVCVCVADGTASVTEKRLPDGARDVGPRSTLQLFRAAEAKSTPFPPDAEPGSAHTRDLVDFLAGP